MREQQFSLLNAQFNFAQAYFLDLPFFFSYTTFPYDLLSANMKLPSIPWAHYVQVVNTEQHDGQSDGLLQDESGLAEEAGPLRKRRDVWAWRNWRIALETAILTCSIVVLFAAVRQRPSLLDQRRQCGSLWGQWRKLAPCAR